MKEIKASFNGYSILLVEHIGQANILQPDNSIRYGVKITNTSTKRSARTSYWAPAGTKVSTSKEALKALASIFYTALCGGLDPKSFCELTGANIKMQRSEIRWELAREANKNMAKLTDTAGLKAMVIALQNSGLL